jgi:AcrR family transcriptional regulator
MRISSGMVSSVRQRCSCWWCSSSSRNSCGSVDFFVGTASSAMARQIPTDRFTTLIAAGTATFVAQGYRRTQMQDVADAMSVSKGTLYGVVTSKDALLLACVRHADVIDPEPDPSAWPLPSPIEGELVGLVTDRLSEVGDLALHQIADTEPDAEPGAVDAEPDLIVTDLLRRLDQHRRAIKLVDRCAPEIPDLAQLWYGAGRTQLVDRLREYLTQRAGRGLIRLTADPAHWDIVARTIVETCVLWAVHLPWDPAPPHIAPPRPTPTSPPPSPHCSAAD